MVEQIDELHQEIEQFKTEIPTEDNSTGKFDTQLENIINIGVTNKTVSRWENGNYIPPAECLAIRLTLSHLY